MRRQNPPASKQATHQRDRHFKEPRVDPYKARVKQAGTAICPQCGAISTKGRWHWGEKPKGAEAHLCQACHRTNDRMPAGIVLLTGGYLEAHKDEILNLARHQEALEKAEHPLNRIMAIAQRPAEIEISTTDIHLPRRIGEAVKHAHSGEVAFHYNEDEYFIRVNWTRDR